MAMPMLAPVYRSTKRQSLLARQLNHETSERNGPKEGVADENVTQRVRLEPDETAEVSRRSSFLPVNATDPYHVAGHPREQSLPSFPYPHAPAKDIKTPNPSIEQELARLNPPVYIPGNDTGDSTKKRHLDNLTAILHRCMLQGQWQRASRVWGLLVRTEISGQMIDVRQHGRWAIGAEILLRRDAETKEAGPLDDSAVSLEDSTEGDLESLISDNGFELARAYYQRLIIQYPQTPHNRNHVNATVIYPALYSIWVFEVQARSKRGMSETMDDRLSSSSAERVSSATSRAIREREVEGAEMISRHLDDLLLNPPYDNNPDLLRIRANIGRWLADLYDLLMHATSDVESEEIYDGQLDHRAYKYRGRYEQEKHTTRRIMQKLSGMGNEAVNDP